MGILSDLLSPRAVAGPSPWSDFWYSDVGQSSLSGVPITADTALKIATAWRCVGLLSNSIGILPLHVYRRLPGGGKERAEDHPLDGLIGTAPNSYQTAIEWRTQQQAQLLLRGNGYNRMVRGTSYFVGEIQPLENERMDLPKLEKGRMVYRYREADYQAQTVPDDEIMHLRGLSLDGITGLSTLRYQRENFGRTIATNEFAARYFSQNGTPAGVLETDQTLLPEQAKQYAASWHAARTGLSNAHKVAILGKGLKFHGVTVNPEDMQMLESRDTDAYEICTIFGVPPHMAGLVSKTTSWGTGIEQQNIAFVVYTLQGWATRWEQRINQSLLTERDRRAGYFVEHNLAGLLRGDSAARSAFYRIMREIGAYSINDVLRFENLNAISDAWADEHMVPLNYRDASKPAPAPAPPASGRGAALARAAARRIVGKELAVIRKTASRTGTDLEAWRAAVGEFYSQHASYVTEHLQVTTAEADAYCKLQADALIEHGAAALAEWEEGRVEHLVRLALGEPTDMERMAA